MIQVAAALYPAERHAGPRHRLHRRNQRERNWTRPDSPSTNRATIIGKFGIERQYNDMSEASTASGRWWWITAGRAAIAERDKPAIPGKDLSSRSIWTCRPWPSCHGWQERRRGRARSAQRRSAGHGQPAHVRSQQICRAHQVRGLERDRRESRPSVAEPRHPGAAGAGLHLQAVRGAGGLETGAIDDTDTVHCPGGVTLYGHYLPLLDSRATARSPAHAIVHSCDAYFYNVGASWVSTTSPSTRNMVGFGQPTGIDLPERPRDWCLRRTWKLRNIAENGTPARRLGGHRTGRPDGDAAADSRAPSAGLAMGGVWRSPHLW